MRLVRKQPSQDTGGFPRCKPAEKGPGLSLPVGQHLTRQERLPTVQQRMPILCSQLQQAVFAPSAATAPLARWESRQRAKAAPARIASQVASAIPPTDAAPVPIASLPTGSRQSWPQWENAADTGHQGLIERQVTAKTQRPFVLAGPPDHQASNAPTARHGA